MHSRFRLSLAFVALASTSALAACAWSVPADPGRNAAQRSSADAFPAAQIAGTGRGAGAPAADTGARAIYLDKCSKCHEPFPPTHVPAEEWPALVRKYGPRAGLFGSERAAVLDWLQANAR